MTDFALPYRDRVHAGRLLAGALAPYRGHPSLLVLALPRGGVAVGREVARELRGAAGHRRGAQARLSGA